MSFFRRREKTSPSSPQESPPLVTQTEETFGTGLDYGDRQRAKARYKEAAHLLKKSIEIRRGPWRSFDFQDLSGEPEEFDDAKFRNKINTALTQWESTIKDRKSWSKYTYTIECIFTALSPFAKNFLTIANEAQSVPPLFSLLLRCCRLIHGGRY